jgi:protein-disulfide isomerase
MEINGTPSFVMGDTLLRGYVPLEGMQQIIADERAG